MNAPPIDTQIHSQMNKLDLRADSARLITSSNWRTLRAEKKLSWAELIKLIRDKVMRRVCRVREKKDDKAIDKYSSGEDDTRN